MTSTPQPDKPQRRILLVDDDTRLLRIIALQLRLSGVWMVVGSADNLADARELARAQHPELVLLDLWLGQTNSLGLLAELRTLSPSPQVVILSGEVDPAWRERALAAGASAYLSKLQLVHIPDALRALFPAP